MGDMSRCPHGDFSGYCMRCNEWCPQCKGTGDLREEDDGLCPRCSGLGLVPLPKPPRVPWWRKLSWG